MATNFENVPQIKPTIDQDGYVRISPQEWAMLMLWLQKFKTYTQENLP